MSRLLLSAITPALPGQHRDDRAHRRPGLAPRLPAPPMRTSSKAEPAVDFAEEAADDRVQPVGGPVWLWPSRVRRPDWMMTGTPASAIPCNVAISGGMSVVSLIAAARRSVSSSVSRCTAGLMAAR